MPTTEPTLATQSASPRRHDLDALRAGAMLLGIVLHAGMSFFDNPMWPAQDASRAPAMGLVVMAIHGFRMPLFFLLSGYFTAMLAGRRGLGGLLRHRGKRIALPLAVGMATIVPLVWAVSIWGYMSPTTATSGAAPTADTSIWVAAGEGSVDALRRHLDSGADPDELDPAYRVPPLAWAIVADEPGAVAFLLEAGADPGVKYGDGNTPLHTACFFGRADAARLLVDAGAPVDARSPAGETPADVMRYDRATTEGVARAIRTEIDFDQVDAGREEIRTFLPDAQAAEATGGSAAFGPAMLRGLLFEFPVFHHLWFLWFLCWLVPGYALAVLVLRPLAGVRLPRAVTILAAPPVCLLWLVPLTMLAQWPMTSGGTQPGFGPDTSVGLLPIPRVLAYYAVFFGAGAVLFTARGATARLGRGWWLTLPLALAVLAPAMSLGLKSPWPQPLASVLSGHATSVHVLAVAGQALYAWLMIFGLIGLFEFALGRERFGVRYLSDASYWLYVAHLPLVVALQIMLRNVDLPAAIKMPIIVLVTVGVLLGAYQIFVRYTAIGRMLNGPRVRPTRPEPGGRA